jgi:HEAT repeat protein
MDLMPVDQLTAAMSTGAPEDRRLVTDVECTLAHVDERVAEEYLRIASCGSDDETRAWAAQTAGNLLGVRAVPLITPLLFDRSADVRSLVIGALAHIRHEALRPHLDRLLGELTTTNAGQVLWVFIRLRAHETSGQIREFASSLPASHRRHKLATIAATYIDDGTSGIGRYLSDPAYCAWAAYVLAKLGTEEAADTLRSSAAHPTSCRKPIAAAIEHLEEFLRKGNDGFHEVDGRRFNLASGTQVSDRTEVMHHLTTALTRGDRKRRDRR